MKKEGEAYYLSSACMLQVFRMGKYPYPLQAPFGVLNLSSDVLTIRQMKEQFPNYFDSSLYGFDNLISDISVLKKYYLSKEVLIKEDTGYQFWTFTDWNVVDGWNIQRGADRFIFIPGKGIVGGSYDFWFLKPPVPYVNYEWNNSRERIWDNVIREKVMIAEELRE